MADIDMDKVRSVMYSKKRTRKTKTQEDQSVKMTSGDAILIESEGRKILVPTQAAFQRVLEENYKLKNQVNRLEAMIKSVNNSAKNIDHGLKIVENELRNKADKFN